MDRQAYEAYLECFNRKDYDGVLDHFSENPEVAFAGYAFRGKQTIRDFYAFFHDHIEESIQLQHFIGNADMVAIEASVQLTAIRDLPADVLKKRGLSRLVSLEKGQVFTMPQFIHYHLIDGKFASALCSVFEAPVEIITNLNTAN